MKDGVLLLFLVALATPTSTVLASPKSVTHDAAAGQEDGQKAARSRRHASESEGAGSLEVDAPYYLTPDADPDLLEELEEVADLSPWQLQALLREAAREEELGSVKSGWDSKPLKHHRDTRYDDDDDDNDDDENGGDLPVAKRPFGRLMGGYKLNFGRLFGKRMYHHRNQSYRRYRRRGFGRVLGGGYLTGK